jgi:hypothetical protein
MEQTRLEGVLSELRRIADPIQKEVKTFVLTSRGGVLFGKLFSSAAKSGDEVGSAASLSDCFSQFARRLTTKELCYSNSFTARPRCQRQNQLLLRTRCVLTTSQPGAHSSSLLNSLRWDSGLLPSVTQAQSSPLSILRLR